MRFLSLFPLVITYFFALIGYLFIYWRRLKEDYAPQVIFASGFIIIISIAVASLIALIAFGSVSYAFWIAIGIYLVAFYFVLKKYRLRGYETFEASGMGLLFIVLVSSLWSFVASPNPASFVLVLLPILAHLIFGFLDSRYKRFTWYSSGRVGFAGLTAILLYFLMRSVVVVFAPSTMLSFSGSIVLGKIDIVFCGITAALLFIYIYSLAKGK